MAAASQGTIEEATATEVITTPEEHAGILELPAVMDAAAAAAGTATATATIPPKEEDKKEEDEKLQLPKQEEAEKETIPPLFSKNERGDEPQQYQMNARQWFISKLQNSPPDEPMAALGFCDPVFVELCIQTLVVRGRTQTTAAGATAHGGGGRGWNQKVCWPESRQNKQRTTVDTTRSSKQGETESLRIATATTAPGEDKEEEKLKQNQHEPDQEQEVSQYLSILTNHLVVAVPCTWAGEENNNNNGDEESLYITLDTTNHTSTSELLSALDGLTFISFQRSFLESAPKHQDSTTKPSPLYAFLLALLERAVQHAYQQETGTTTTTTSSAPSSYNHSAPDKLQTLLLSRREQFSSSLTPQLLSDLQVEDSLRKSLVSKHHNTTMDTNAKDNSSNVGSLLILMPFPYLQSIFLSDKNDIEDWKDVISRIGMALSTTATATPTKPPTVNEVTNGNEPVVVVVPSPETPKASTTAHTTTQSQPSTPASATNANSNQGGSNKKRSKKKKKRKNKNRASGAGDGKDQKSNNNNTATVQPESRGKEMPSSNSLNTEKTKPAKEDNNQSKNDEKAQPSPPVEPTVVTPSPKNVSKNANAGTPKSPDGGGRGGGGGGKKNNTNNNATPNATKSEKKTATTTNQPQHQQPAKGAPEPAIAKSNDKEDVAVAPEVPVSSPSTGENTQQRNESAKSQNHSSESNHNGNKHHDRSNHHHNHHHRHNNNSSNDSADWETVSSRSRGRKGGKNEKATGGTSAASQQQQQANNGDSRTNNHKNHSNNKDHNHHQRGHRNFHNQNNNQYHSFRGRKNNSTRKIAREILYSVLDGVDNAVKNQTLEAPPAPAPAGRWAGLDSNVKTTTTEALNSKKGTVAAQDEQQQTSLPNNCRNGSNKNNKKQGRNNSNRGVDADKEKKNPPQEVSPKPTISATARSNGLASPPADQSTAPTYQETVSAISTASNTVTETPLPISKEAASANKDLPPSFYQFMSKGREGIVDSMDGVDASTHPSDQVPAKNISPDDQIRLSAPPLPTLLSAENANSTTSSVASSLEAPNGRNQHHNQHHPSQNDPNAVGYHLLNVCDQLSNDMALFMKSRTQALSLRRNERSILLGALQEVVSGIWPSPCCVEMYGSCATLLDLPSSDLDVVVVGLDNRSSGVFPWNATTTDYATNSATSLNRSQSSESSHSGHMQSSVPPTVSPPPYIPPPFSANAHRVMKLSAEIERLPWAVKVKSIPNATVPVIKILADPSKIPGFSTIGNEWQGYGMPPPQQSFATTSTSGSPPENQPWRGSDLMNGLISLDITFQGPEHGGLGSTEYSLHVVNQACQESGLANPDDTPFVQCLMVLKELLAQRKLNEPYSGGLSSYALLLLLTALLRERAAIREEINRAEQLRQSMAVAADSMVPASCVDDLNHSCSLPVAEPEPSQGAHGSFVENKGSDTEEGRKTPQARGTPASASWASVAKSTEQVAVASSVDTAQSAEKQSITSPRVEEERKPISFADAVAKSKSTSTADKNLVSQTSNKDPVPSSRRANGKKDKKGQQVILDQPSQNKKADSSDPTARSKKPISSDLSANGKKTGQHKDTVKGSKNNGNSGADAFQLEIPNFQADHSFVPTCFPQGFDDVIEVLCLGETTSGKLLMHFLLHYGQYFDSMSTAIDISGKHERVLSHPTPYFYLTPFIERSAPESIDPHTGMLVVDHIVIYDPLEGAEDHNVARRCFAWQQVRWIFAQSYATLSRAVEKSASTMVGTHSSQTHMVRAIEAHQSSKEIPLDPELVGDVGDSSYPLLRCLLSF